VRWATRPQCHVDRTACAWLIRRFVDPDAEFLFVEELIDVPPDANAFDMRGARLSHHNGDCSFETFLAEYALDDAALERLAQIVHEADVGDGKFEAPEAPGLDLTIRALAVGRDDNDLLRETDRFYDGVYATFTGD
jgi:hypothetical protein